MEHIIINSKDTDNHSSLKLLCARAILTDGNNVLVERFSDGSILLPGTSFLNPNLDNLLLFLQHRLGVKYKENELVEKILVEYLDGCIDVDDLTLSRDIITKYYLGKYKGIDYSIAKCINSYKFIDIDEVIKMTSGENSESNNRETYEVLKVLKKVR